MEVLNVTSDIEDVSILVIEGMIADGWRLLAVVPEVNVVTFGPIVELANNADVPKSVVEGATVILVKEIAGIVMTEAPVSVTETKLVFVVSVFVVNKPLTVVMSDINKDVAVVAKIIIDVAILKSLLIVSVGTIMEKFCVFTISVTVGNKT